MKRYTSTAIVDYQARSTDEISFKEGDIIIILSDAGNGMVLGECNNEYGVQKGVFPLKYVVVDAIAEKVSNKQKLMQQMKGLKSELAETKLRRTEMQEDVKKLREQKELQNEEDAKYIFSLRSKEELIVHLIQLEIELLLLSNGIQEFRTCNNQSLLELQRFKETVESSDLDQLKLSLVERIENLRIKTGFVRSPVEDSLTSCKAIRDMTRQLLDKLLGAQSPETPQPEEKEKRKFVFGVKPSIKDLTNVNS